MKRLLTLFVVLVAVPVAAQDHRPPPPTQGDGGHARPAPSSPSSPSSPSAPAAPRGGTSSGGGASSGAGTSGGARSGGGGGGTAPAPSAAPRATGRRDAGRDASAPNGSADATPRHARPRNGDEPTTGTAVPRGSVPPPNGGTVVVSNGMPLYPWWLGGAGAYGAYGGYYGGYYDPWFGGYYDDPAPVGSVRYGDEGKLRLKIKPREAEVYVDGYYVGIVDEFDGVFQRLTIESGPHRIEVRAPGYEPLAFDVRITSDHTTTYNGELVKLQ